MLKVYLAGPISGNSYRGATSWRKYAIDCLDGWAQGISPMRAKSYLEDEESIADSYEHIALGSSRGITTRDRWDVSRCDILLANLSEAHSKVSIGTAMEIAWADAYRKPIILVMKEGQGNVHDHAMIRECAGYIVPTLIDAIRIIRAIADE